jgi:CBS-domain-containing membrane protein
MIASNFITDEIPPLKTSDTGLKALGWMDEFKVSHLPVVNGTELLGVVSDTELLDMNNAADELGNSKQALMRPHVFGHQHIYDAMKQMSLLNLTLIPVLDQEQHYMGVITLTHLMQQFSKLAAIQEPGGIIILELNNNDYSLSQIAQIIEGNDAKVLSLYVTPHPDSTKMEITVKVNKEDLSGILQTFFRYNYIVKASFHQSEFLEDLKNRYDSFMNYINM